MCPSEHATSNSAAWSSATQDPNKPNVKNFMFSIIFSNFISNLKDERAFESLGFHTLSRRIELATLISHQKQSVGRNVLFPVNLKFAHLNYIS